MTFVGFHIDSYLLRTKLDMPPNFLFNFHRNRAPTSQTCSKSVKSQAPAVTQDMDGLSSRQTDTVYHCAGLDTSRNPIKSLPSTTSLSNTTTPPVRVLVIGSCGSGKSSLVNCIVGKPVLEVSDDGRSSQMEINNGIYTDDGRFVLHEGRGWELAEEWDASIMTFVRSHKPHMIWVCLPTPIPGTGSTFLRDQDRITPRVHQVSGNIPVIYVFTKFDRRVSSLAVKPLESRQYSHMDYVGKADSLLHEELRCSWKEYGQQWVAVSTRSNEVFDKRIQELLDLTYATVSKPLTFRHNDIRKAMRITAIHKDLEPEPTVRLRVLVVGMCGAGKSSLINRVLGSPLQEVSDSHPCKWTHVDEELSTDESQFIFHEGPGLEVGSEWDASITKFIQGRRYLSDDQKLHAIWVCLPTPIPDTGSTFLRDQDSITPRVHQVSGNIPVIYAFTKFDRWVDSLVVKLLESNMELLESKMERRQYSYMDYVGKADTLLQEELRCSWKEHGQQWVAVDSTRSNEVLDKRIQKLLDLTYAEVSKQPTSPVTTIAVSEAPAPDEDDDLRSETSTLVD